MIGQTGNRERTFIKWALGLTAIALIIDALLAWNTYGTNDVDMWLTSSLVAQGQAPIDLYRHLVTVKQVNGGSYEEVFNHPPFVLYLLGKFDGLRRAVNLPFHTLFRLLSSLASIATVLLVCGLVRNRVKSKWNLLLYALSPVSILVAAFHGNSDPWLILFLVATVWSVEKQYPPVLTGLLFALAINIKMLPIFLVPALFFGLGGRRERVVCFATIGLTSFALWLPFLLQDHRAVLNSTFGYGSQFGVWGIGYLIQKTIFIWKYSFYSKYAILLLCVLLAWCMNRPAARIPLFDQFGITLFLFMFLTPGFGVQYLYWLTPWAVVLGTRSYFPHWAISGIFLFAAYNWWCRGIPWWYADAITAPMNGTAQVLGVLSWITVGAVLFGYHRRYPTVLPLAVNLLREPRATLRAAYSVPG